MVETTRIPIVLGSNMLSSLKIRFESVSPTKEEDPISMYVSLVVVLFLCVCASGGRSDAVVIESHHYLIRGCGLFVLVPCR